MAQLTARKGLGLRALKKLKNCALLRRVAPDGLGRPGLRQTGSQASVNAQGVMWKRRSKAEEDRSDRCSSPTHFSGGQSDIS